jgi:hypothetical protein
MIIIVYCRSFQKFWGPQIDPRLAQYLSNFLFGSGQQKSPSVDFNRFAELYVYNVRGTFERQVFVEYSTTTSNSVPFIDPVANHNPIFYFNGIIIIYLIGKPS